ncbi:MAG TPA: ABC transporter permease [Verrucomicrobiota bacterium]|nr:ABC transporter permease [Verrucomicrobiota bacterium]HNU51582.1 ABC transporter permease [Verrucomicrobiota bacterium]
MTPDFLQSLRGLWHLTWCGSLTWRRTAVIAAVLLANPALAWFGIPARGTTAFLHWTTHLYLGLAMPLYCLVICGGMIRDEVQDDTLGFLLTRPLTRARLFLGKYVCQLAWIQGVVLANSLLLVAVGWLRDVPEALSLATRLLLVGAVGTLVYSALGALFGLLTRRYVVLGLVYGFLVEVGIGHIPTNINALSMMRHQQTLLAGHAAVRDRYAWSADGPWTAALILCGTTALALALGAAVFTLREYQNERTQ